jgi:hypothetical protein
MPTALPASAALTRATDSAAVDATDAPAAAATAAATAAAAAPAGGGDLASNEPEFSMIAGGPLYQLFVRAHFVQPPVGLLGRRIAGISLLAWLPLLVLSVIAGRAWGGATIPFLYDIDAHVRFLVALPLLVLAEWLVHVRFRPLVMQFIERSIIRPSQRPAFDEIVASCQRLRNSTIVEALVLVLVLTLGPVAWRSQAAVPAPTWYANPVGSTLHLTLPGYYYLFVALPLFQFILLRWYFRIFIWCRFLWKVSRLDLNLIPTHPDGAGGLGFLSAAVHAQAPLLAAQSALLAGVLANRIFYEHARLPDFKLEILAMVLFLAIVALGPLMVFIPRLAACQRAGNREYGVLASRYTAEFHDKWIAPLAVPQPQQQPPPQQQELLGSSDIQSLSDLANSFAVIRSMTVVPFNRVTVVRVVVIALLPTLPLLLTVVPLSELVDQLVKVLL